MLQADPNDRAEATEENELLVSMLGELCQSHSLQTSASGIASAILDSTDVDRVAVLETQGGASHMLAIAPSGRIESRSTQVKALECLVSEIGRTSNQYDLRIGESTPAKHSPTLSDYIDQSGCRWLHVEIATTGKAPDHRAAIVVESFSIEDRCDATAAISQQAALIMQLAIDRQSTGLFGALSRWRASSIGRKSLLVTVLLAICLLAMAVIPADLKLAADGHLRPVDRRGIFAPREGVIQDIVVSHGDVVQNNQRLLQVKNADLELQQSQLEGELATLRSQLASVVAARSQRSRDTSDRSPSEFSAQEEDLEIRIEGIKEQLGMVVRSIEDLVIVSPQKGIVDGVDLRTSLENRPVTMGQHLFDVFDTNGDWELVLDVPDDSAGYLLVAHHKSPCTVEYRVRSDPNVTYTSEIVSVANSTQVDHRGLATVRATAPVDTSKLGDLHAGANVVAKIHCGRRSLGFVWFRELIEFVQRHGML